MEPYRNLKSSGENRKLFSLDFLLFGYFRKKIGGTVNKGLRSQRVAVFPGYLVVGKLMKGFRIILRDKNKWNY